jgi:hypothetical protein
MEHHLPLGLPSPYPVEFQLSKVSSLSNIPDSFIQLKANFQGQEIKKKKKKKHTRMALKTEN